MPGWYFNSLESRVELIYLNKKRESIIVQINTLKVDNQIQSWSIW